MRYPVEFIPEDNGTITVYVPDIPGCHTFGGDQSEALARAVDAAEGMLAAMIQDGEGIPPPSGAEGRATIAIPAISVAKIGLYQALREVGMEKAELAHRLGWQLPEMDRVLDLNYPAKLEQVEVALRALGKQLEVQVLDAA